MIKLWTHQEAAYNWMSARDYGIINAGMGTGKTMLAIEYVRRTKARKVLIVAPSKIVDVWKEEYAFLGLPAVVDDNALTVRAQAEKLRQMTGEFVYATSYPRIWRPHLFEALKAVNWDVVFFDESHHISAHNSHVSKAAAAVAHLAPKRFALTGTLMRNNPTNVFGQARAMHPALFDRPGDRLHTLNSFNRFRERYCHLYAIAPNVHIITGYRDMDEFNRMLSEFVYVIDSDQVLDLPEEMHIYRRVRMEPDLARQYKTFSKEAIVTTERGTMVASNALVKATRLHQLAGGTMTYDNGETEWVNSVKLEALLELVGEINQEEPIVVFAKFTPEINLIAEALRKNHIDVGELSGNANDLAAWQRGEFRVLVVQTATGSEGIDLSRACYTIFYSMEFSLGAYEQAIRRTRRPRKDGTKAPTTFYYHLLCSGTIDDIIEKALKDKADIVQSVLEHMKGFGDD